jgi:uncharacterized protein (DUF2235 family)
VHQAAVLLCLARIGAVEPQTPPSAVRACRGAHTIRSVAGMINNCGILDRSKLQALPLNQANGKREPAAVTLHKACASVYRIYRSRDPQFKPTSAFCKEFRSARSHSTSEPPIRFLGLLDTVGALGVPNVNAGGPLRHSLSSQLQQA